MAITILKEWKVKLLDCPKPLILYAEQGEDLSCLDKLLMNSLSIELTGRCGLGSDGKNTYDGVPAKELTENGKELSLKDEGAKQ